MKRIMSLVGAIIGIVFDAIFSLIMLIGITALLDLLSGSYGSGLIAVVGILLLALGVVGLIFNILVVGAFTWDHDKYVKKRAIVITAAVLNFVTAVFALITLCTAFTAFYLLWFLTSVAAGVLIIVDLCLEGKRFAQLQAAQQEQAPADPFEQK